MGCENSGGRDSCSDKSCDHEQAKASGAHSHEGHPCTSDHHDEHADHGGCNHDEHKGCNHHHHDDGHDHEGCGHDHHHHHEAESYNHGILKKVYSMAGVDPDGFFEWHRSKAVLAAAGTLAAIEYHTMNTSVAGTLAMIFGSAAVAHDASEDLMEATGKLKETHNISGGLVGVGVGAAHTVSEGWLTVSSQFSGYEDVAISTTMGSNVSHIPLMAGAAGLIGAVSIDKYSAYKMNSVAMMGVTGGFGYQIATAEFNPYISAGMVGVGAAYLLWRVRAGQTCAVHGDACGHVHEGEKDETDYISTSYWRDLAKKVKNIEAGDVLSRLSQTVQTVKDKIFDLSLMTHHEMLSWSHKAVKAVSHENIVTVATSLAALGVSAHVLGDNVMTLAEQGGLSATATGATVAALAFALPELILTAKAAWKNDGEMAWGAVTGCTIATVGIVGGYQGFGDFDVPANLSLDITEGKVQMGAFLGSAAAIVLATHPKIARQFAKADNAVADWFEKQAFLDKTNRVSNWLRNDGTKLSKVVAAPMLVAAMAYYATNTQPNCHWHGNRDFPHCINLSEDPISEDYFEDILRDPSSPDNFEWPEDFFDSPSQD